MKQKVAGIIVCMLVFICFGSMTHAVNQSTTARIQELQSRADALDTQAIEESVNLLDSADETQRRADMLRSQAERESACDESGNCLDKTNFTITVNDISPGVQIDSDKTAKQNVEATFVTLIEKLIYALGALAILIMTIGGGYMIMYNGQDELLSKGKSIFMAGIISVFVALGAGIIINLIRFILYA